MVTLRINFLQNRQDYQSYRQHCRRWNEKTENCKIVINRIQLEETKIK